MVEAKVVKSSELLDRKENPSLCLSALRQFDKCHLCAIYKQADKLKCKPRITEEVKGLLSRRAELAKELRAVDEKLREGKPKIVEG